MAQMHPIEVADGERNRDRRARRKVTQDTHSLSGKLGVVGSEENGPNAVADAARTAGPATPAGRSREDAIVTGGGGRGPRAPGLKTAAGLAIAPLRKRA